VTIVDQVDSALRGLWPAAVAGDTKSADTVLRVIDRRMRLLGLDVSPDAEEWVRAGLGDGFTSMDRRDWLIGGDPMGSD